MKFFETVAKRLTNSKSSSKRSEAFSKRVRHPQNRSEATDKKKTSKSERSDCANNKSSAISERNDFNKSKTCLTFGAKRLKTKQTSKPQQVTYGYLEGNKNNGYSISI